MRYSGYYLTKSHLIVFSVALVLCPGLRLSARSSANYSITPEIQDTGGAQSTAGVYRIDNSIGAIGTLNGGGGNVGKNGYIGQLYDVAGLVVDATPTSVNETQTRQLSAAQLLDDATFIAVPASSVSWQVLSGPISGISGGGLATAGTVFQDTSASVQGTYQNKDGSLNLTVVNVGTDDFGTYANDGIDDSWQVQYFGQDNPNAGPNVDADGTGQTNLFKFIAGLNPVDGSRFLLSISPVNGQPTQKNLIFSPIVSARTYVVQFATVLQSPTSWSDVVNTSQSDNGDERTVTDLNATPAPKFYRVQITK